MNEPRSHLWASYAGGMNATASPRLVRDDQLQMLVNGTVRGGFASPRPGFRQIELAWRAQTIQFAFERGVFQGLGGYLSRQGARLLFAFDGELLSWNPRTQDVRRLLSQAPFSRHSRNVWFCQRGRYAIAQDGVSPPVVIDGDTATQGTDSRRGTPTGCMMAEGHGRLFVVSPCRRRIYAGNHSADPEADDLDFTEDTSYFLNARYFEVPEREGPIVALAFSPALNGDADLGPLLVFTQQATRAYDVSLPREKWLTQDISTVPLPDIGACAHAAVAVRGNDVLFSDHEGRIQTVRMAVARNDDARVDVIDRPVQPLYDRETADLRHARWTARHDERTLTTVRPEIVWRSDNRWTVRHRGIVALNESPAVPLPFVWDGLWTGIYPAAMLTLESRCYVVSLDGDGIHRLYEIDSRTAGTDHAPAPRPVPMLAGLNSTDGGSPFLAKPVDAFTFRLGGALGTVGLHGWWQSDRNPPADWFAATEGAADCMAWNPPMQPAPSTRPRINPPAPQTGNCFEAAPWLEITGQATLEECMIGFRAPLPTSSRVNTTCQVVASARAVSACQGPNPWAYHARTAPAAGESPISPTCHTHS